MGESTKKIRLKSAYINDTNGKYNIAFTFSGNEMALAAADSLIRESYKAGAYTERDAAENTLKVVVSLDEHDQNKQASDIAQQLHTLTGFHLSHVIMQQDFDQIGEGKKALFSPAITINAVHNPHDEGNLAGDISVEIMRRQNAMQVHFIPDPRIDLEATLPPRLICVDRSFQTDSDALLNAETTIREIEASYGLHKVRTNDLTMSSLQTRTMQHRSLGDHELSLSIARLNGAPDALDEALRSLKRRHRSRIVELGRDDGYIDIGAAAQDHMDPTGLLAAVHMTTGCKLPVDFTPRIASSKDDRGYQAVLEARIHGDDTGLLQPTMRYAAARYAGSFVPAPHSVPEECDPHMPSRIILHKPYPNELFAKAGALELAKTVQKHLQADPSLGHDHHAH